MFLLKKSAQKISLLYVLMRAAEMRKFAAMQKPNHYSGA